jgi:hypothetical protein
MDHVEATHIQAPSRYLRDELSPSEARAFEEHFFSCPECADELRLEDAFAENARAVFLDESREQCRRAQPGPAPRAQLRPEPGSHWWERFRFSFPATLAAAVCLLAVVAVQNLTTIPHLKTEVAQLSSGEAPFAFPLTRARGDAGESVTVPPRSAFFMPYFLLPGGAAFARYTCDVQTRDGVNKKHVTVDAPPPGQPLGLLLLRSEFPSGIYSIKVRGDNAQDPIATYTMRIK